MSLKGNFDIPEVIKHHPGGPSVDNIPQTQVGYFINI